MAKQTLQTNFVDDILEESMSGKRRYNLIQNDDGTVSLEDVTNYSQIGSSFGAAQVNAMNNAINESADKSKIIDNLSDIAANQQSGMMAGALAVRELNNNMANMNRYDVYKATGVGDSDFPLKSCLEISFSNVNSPLNMKYKISQTASGAHLAGLPSALSEVTCVVYRTVFFSSSTVHTCVKLEELHPNPGRVWYNYYNAGTWTGWKNIVPA